ncbi:MAG: 2OG-Fe(II) oxygenase [Acidobacteria bacterium]|nr:2OG-Fe(II) oxygenase [Acidobacteriota bacterium]
MLNSPVKAQDYAERFQREGLIEVENFLNETAAQQFHRILDAELQWQLSFLSGGRVRQIPQSQLLQMKPQELEQLDCEVAAQAARGFQFRFMRAALCEGSREATGLAAQLMTELVEFGRSVTGDVEIAEANMYGSYYAPGSYLKSHNDVIANGRRRAAYVLSLTRKWELDWGGLLVFEDEKAGRVQQALVPSFNRLIFFSVPKAHHVTIVRDYAKGKRYALQGWLSSRSK